MSEPFNTPPGVVVSTIVQNETWAFCANEECSEHNEPVHVLVMYETDTDFCYLDPEACEVCGENLEQRDD